MATQTSRIQFNDPAAYPFNNMAIQPDGDTTPEQEHQKLDTLIDTSSQVLFKSHTVFPFHLFTKEIVIDVNKVSLIDRQFFSSARIRSLTIRTVSDTFVDTGLFFAKLSIIVRDFTENSLHIDYLPKADAIKARRIIQGLMVGYEKGIDFSKLNPQEIIDKLEEIGKIYND